MSIKDSLVFCLHLIVYVSTSPSPPAVVIVGAGAAGLAAATRLAENGYTNTIILEAENRIGGRVNSVFFGDAYVDLGAEWCHGEKDNIVYEMVKDLGILNSSEELGRLYHSSRKLDEEFLAELLHIVDYLYEAEGAGRAEEEGISLGQRLRDRYNATIYQKFGNDAEKLEIAKSAIDFFQKVVLSFEGAFSWDEPSANPDYRQSEGNQNLNWNGLGFKTILEVVMRKFPDPSKQIPLNIFLNKEVAKITWNSIESVSVVCSDNTTYSANHVIFTPSIGVLKEQHEKIFTPALPETKQQAIKAIGFGPVMKVFLHFDDPWWLNTNTTDFYFFWSEEDRNNANKEFPRGAVKDGRSWLTALYSIIPAENNPNVRTAWFTGDLVPEIELLDSTTLLEGIDFFLRKFLGHQHNITKPDKMIRSSWFSNPHFRGCYSYQTIEARKNKESAEFEMGQPLTIDGRPTILFAGEASHPYHYSTVHGAIETGHREANRIINYHTH